jgi:hypothetical protein
MAEFRLTRCRARSRSDLGGVVSADPNMKKWRHEHLSGTRNVKVLAIPHSTLQPRNTLFDEQFERVSKETLDILISTERDHLTRLA